MEVKRERVAAKKGQKGQENSKVVQRESRGLLAMADVAALLSRSSPVGLWHLVRSGEEILQCQPSLC